MDGKGYAPIPEKYRSSFLPQKKRQFYTQVLTSSIAGIMLGCIYGTEINGDDLSVVLRDALIWSACGFTFTMTLSFMAR